MVGTEIKFTIDNFSGIIDINEWLLYMKNNNYHYRHPEKKPHMVKTNIKGVYILYDKFKKPIYVGKSQNCMRQRLRTHLETKPKSYDMYENLFTLYKRGHYKYFSFIETQLELAPFLEYYFIQKYKPRYNREFHKNFKYEDDWYVFLKQNKSDELNKKELLEQDLYKKNMNSVII